MNKISTTAICLFVFIAGGLASAAAAQIDAPRAVMSQIVSGLTAADSGSSDLAFDPCPALCDPAFTAIKRQSDMLGTTPDEDIPYIYNVFCQCEDHNNQTFRIVSDNLVSTSRYEARIVGSDKGQKPWTFVLVPISGIWKVSDVIDQTGSVRAGMANAIRNRKHH